MHRLRRTLACALAVLSTASVVAPALASAAKPTSMPWSVISRFGGDANGDGQLDDPTPLSPADFNVFPVVVRPSLAVCAADSSARWFVDGRERRLSEAPVQTQGECRAILRVRGEGRHRVEVRVGAGSEVAPVEVDDRLVVALGDSVASGEGNPEGAKRWLDAPCHRSSVAGFEQATRLLAEALTHDSITFVSLACSGAEVREGLLEPYLGVAPAKGEPPYRPQVERLQMIREARIGSRMGPTVDAVLLSVGANDVQFADIVKACAAPGDCRQGRQGKVFNDLETLRRNYDVLAGRLASAAPGSPVLVTEYFDPTRDEQGRFCRRSVGFTTQAEARWAYEALLRPLNAEVSSAAVRNGWRFVGGIAADFERHGYCADPVERWVRRLGGSLFSQHDLRGTLHPSKEGHAAIGHRVAVELDEALGLRVKPEGVPETKDEGPSTPEWIGIAVGGTLASAAVASLVWLLATSPLGTWPWLVIGWLLALVLLPLGLLLLLALLALRLLRLLRPTNRRDPCGAPPAPPELRPLRRPGSLGQWLIVVGAVAVLIVLAVLFAGVVGSAILWLRFWSARLPADQAVDAVSRSELVTTGTQALALFVVLGLIAVGVAWLLDGKGQWVRSTRRGLVAIVVVEVFVAILIGAFRRSQALELLAGFVLAALLFHFLLDRVLAINSVFRSQVPLGNTVLRLLRRLTRLFGPLDGRSVWLRALLLLLRLLPLVLLGVAVTGSLLADGTNRKLFVLLPLLLAATLFVAPGGLATRGTAHADPDEAELETLEPARIALAVAGLVCVMALITRDEAWLAATAGVATLLALFCLTVAAASGERFAPYGLAVLISVPLFGAAAAMLRGVDSPELQPVAVVLNSGKPLCGVYVGESDGKLWVGRLQLDERGVVRRPRAGSLLSVDSDKIATRVIGPLEPVARAQRQAVALRDGLLNARGDLNLRRRTATCEARKPELPVDRSWQRKLAERYQPELIVDRKDGFWPIPVTTLFSMQDRRAAACRRVGGGDDNGCVRLTTQGAFPWSGGQGEAIEYPAADNRTDEQHDLMTSALGTIDPDTSAREYFLVAGEPGRNRPITIQYWFFYSFNYQRVRGHVLTAGYHEGDFESVGVLLSARTHRPRYFWMARHNDEGRIFPWDDGAVTKVDDHPRVFVARGSHASYESCGPQARFAAPAHLIDDHPTCEEPRQLHLAPEATPIIDLSRVSWGCWHGHFGHRSGGRGYEEIPYLVNDAPLSPLWQQKFDGVVSQPCRGLRDPGGRDGPGEEVVEERQGVPATLRQRTGRLEPLVDECADWESAPTVGTYMVACNQDALGAYIRSGLEDPGTAGVRIDVADRAEPQVGDFTVPAVRRDPAGVYLDSWRITAANPTTVSVYASCRQGGRIVGARFPAVDVNPASPLRLLDRGPKKLWRLSREDGTPVAEAAPFFMKPKGDKLVETAPEKDQTLACGGD